MSAGEAPTESSLVPGNLPSSGYADSVQHDDVRSVASGVPLARRDDDPGSDRYKARNRRARILELLEQREFVGVQELADMFDMTVQSVRRDLGSLADEGLVLRKRGGAARPPSTGRSSRRFLEDLSTNIQAKERIARTAAGLLKPGEVAFFYSGSTVARVAASIPPETRSGLTIVSNSLPVINEVGDWVDPHLIAVGGLFLQTYMAFVGPQANATFREMSADVAVIGASGIAAAHGLTTPHQLIAEVGGTIVERSQRTIVVADSTKVGRGGLTPIAPLLDIDMLITDAGADQVELDLLREAGIDIQIV
jgi:DeoR/GlpR family transcriptional regulator of sugar metabolism